MRQLCRVLSQSWQTFYEMFNQKRTAHYRFPLLGSYRDNATILSVRLRYVNHFNSSSFSYHPFYTRHRVLLDRATYSYLSRSNPSRQSVRSGASCCQHRCNRKYHQCTFETAPSPHDCGVLIHDAMKPSNVNDSAFH